MSNNTPVVMTIAGSDSGAGAGIQADLKTISARGGYGVCAITALTAQNGLGVYGIMPATPDFLDLQIKTLLKGFPVAGFKTGMLFSSELIGITVHNLRDLNRPLVVDPVCVAKGGHHLLEPSAVASLCRELLPMATLITPNLPEAELLTGLKMNENDPLDFIKECAVRFAAMKVKAALIKGGHFPMAEQQTEITDWLIIPGQEPLPITHQRVSSRHTHGTGCTLSSALCTELARGLDLVEAVRRAQKYIEQSMRHAYAPGHGIGPVNHFAAFKTF